jgi:3-methylcrotonyl-CoA carboxylase alpha subunit
MHHAFKLEENEYNLELSRTPAGYCLYLTDGSVPVNLNLLSDGSALLTVSGSSERILLATRGDDVFIHLGGSAYQLRYEHPLQRLAAQSQGAAEDHVRAPMPGSLVALHVEPGQSVTRGETLLVMESMKMETTIIAPRDGVIEAVHFAVGQTFDRDALLLSLEADAVEGKKP